MIKTKFPLALGLLRRLLSLFFFTLLLTPITESLADSKTQDKKTARPYLAIVEAAESRVRYEELNERSRSLYDLRNSVSTFERESDGVLDLRLRIGTLPKREQDLVTEQYTQRLVEIYEILNQSRAPSSAFRTQPQLSEHDQDLLLDEANKILEIASGGFIVGYRAATLATHTSANLGFYAILNVLHPHVFDNFGNMIGFGMGGLLFTVSALANVGHIFSLSESVRFSRFEKTLWKQFWNVIEQRFGSEIPKKAAPRAAWLNAKFLSARFPEAKIRIASLKPEEACEPFLTEKDPIEALMHKEGSVRIEDLR